MKFSIDKHEKYVVFKLDESRFTNEITPQLKAELIILNAEGYRNIVLDLSEVKECDDSQDLSSLLIGDRLCKKAQGLFVLTGINQCISSILKMSGLDENLSIVGRVEEAEDLIFMDEIEKEMLGSTDQET